MNHKNKPAPKKQAITFAVAQPALLLEFLRQSMPEKPAGKVKSMLEHKQISVDGKTTTKYNFPLRPGQTVQVDAAKRPEPEANSNLPEILYEDAEVIVINKPSGLLSVGTEDEKIMTAYYLLTDYVRQKSPKNRVFIVHRLDRDTSGVLLFARNEQLKLAFQDNWDTLVQYRGYRAVVQGQLREKRGRVHSWLLETTTHIMYSSKTAGDGKEAITNYEVLAENAEYSLLDINLETGRKNQIRVHMKDLGHPVVGDQKYGATQDPMRRLGLHAHKLEVRHPLTGKLLCFETPAPQKFATLTAAK